MTARRRTLAKRRAELLHRSARQREQLSRGLQALDARLQVADDRIAASRRSLAIPLAAGVLAAAWLAGRRDGAAGVLVRAALLWPAARWIGHAITGRQAPREGSAGMKAIAPPYG